ncbi:Ubiquinol-cytochrome C reductase iron-sulfur subunit [hydrothermal vent metagenome]|uniref:Ubiquinol-cytochrome c reductase iron-sulfur subunit n=1 Tax=hydrothermal vent metagenome TaxID=652676 RepID=A0A3B0Z588_9ZZZZ
MASVNKTRRRFLIKSTAAMGVVGFVGASYALIKYMSPSEKARLAGGPVELDISNLIPGQLITVEWRNKPVWVLKRSPEALQRLKQPLSSERLRDPESTVIGQQPDYAKNSLRARSTHEDILVVVGLCTHLGCIPGHHPKVADKEISLSWPGGFYCHCHGSMFDFAGRVFKGVPAPTNLKVPPYYYTDNSVLVIGLDQKEN